MSDPTGTSFRDTLAIVSEEGKRKWIYPRQPSGSYYRARTVLSIGLLAFLFGIPFLRVDGHPFMLLNVVERKFILFGAAFGPHDFYLLGLAMITLIVFIILFTVFFGRLFCGWICPQTVFMEMVFRRIEYWIEGDYRQQRRRDGEPWSTGKFLRKVFKHGIFFLIAVLISNTLLAWLIGTEELGTIVREPLSAHFAGFAAMIAFSALFYWIFASFREQACVLVCPYGRLQGVLLDRNSIVVAYDYRRGEPRARLKRGADRTEGDCIDCRLCVDVCPTGIDIRNGTQLECVNCTACIDACDGVMTKIGKPKRLIRYASAEGIARQAGFRWTAKIIAYMLLFVILAGAFTTLLANRTEIDITILRTPGMFYQEQPDGRVANVYDVKILNKTFSPADVRLSLDGIAGEMQIIGEGLTIPPQGIREAKLLIVLNRASLTGLSTPLLVNAFRDGTHLQRLHTTFLGPGMK